MNWNKILDDLRVSGEINMFGAPQWLVENFEITWKEANKIFEDYLVEVITRDEPKN